MHIAFNTNRSLIGTTRYVSINTHLGVEQSRRDDMESLGYLLIYLANGKLPWQGIKIADKKAKQAQIMDKKMSTLTEVLCRGTCRIFIPFCKFFKAEMATYLNHCKSLKFEDRPEYAFLRKLFRNALAERGLNDAQPFDWEISNPDTIVFYA